MSVYAPPIQRPRGGVFIFVLAAAALLAMFATRILASEHANLAHGAEADQARNCLQQYGPWKTFQDPDGTYHFLCKYPWESTIYDVIAIKIRQGLFGEKTAFIPKGGVWPAIERWLIGKGAHPVRPPAGPFEVITP